jgi:hypothetical protein
VGAFRVFGGGGLEEIENGANFPDGFQVMLSPVDHLNLASIFIDDAFLSPDWGNEFEEG